MGTIDIDYGSLGIGLLLMLIPVYFLWHFKTGLLKPVLIGTVRMIIQLFLGLLAHFTQIYHLYNLLIYNILRRNLQLFITEFCIFSPCIIFISNKNSDKSIEILHISPKYITSVDNLMIHIFSSTFNFLYSFTPSDRLESKS